MHITPWCPPATPGTGTVGARTLSMGAAETTLEAPGAPQRDLGSKQRGREHVHRTSPRSVTVPPGSLITEPAGAAASQPPRRERGCGEPRTAALLVDPLWFPAQGRPQEATRTRARRNLSWSTLQNSQEFQWELEKGGNQSIAVLGCLGVFQRAPKKVPPPEILRVRSLDHRCHLPTTNGQPHPGASGSNSGGPVVRV